MISPFNRLQIERALDEMTSREDGITFQRLARRLLREQFLGLVPHSEHHDLGRDASIHLPSGSVAFCATLSSTISKIRKDIERTMDGYPSTRQVLFCTPKRVSNYTIEKWKEQVNARYGIKLDILERTWVIDECLRPANGFVVAEELGITPPQQKGVPCPITGPITFLTDKEREIEALTSLTCGEDTYFVWYEPPQESIEEKVYLVRVTSMNVSPRVDVAKGADPSCIWYNNQLLVSWIHKPNELESWDVYICAFERDLSLIETRRLISGIRDLCSAPVLVNFAQSPYVFYLNQSYGAPVSIYMHSVISEEVICQELPLKRASHFIAKSRSGRLGCVVDLDTSLHLFEYKSGQWTKTGEIDESVLHGKRISRFDWEIGTPSLLIMDTFGENWNLYTACIGGSRNETPTLWPVSNHGKFPSIVSCQGQWFASWSGAPSLPLDLQGKEFSQTNIEQHLKVMEEIRENTEKLLYNRFRFSGGTELEWEIEKADSIGVFVPPWAPLWLGAIDEFGRCVSSFGPLGYGARENWGTQLSADGPRGSLTWKSGSGEEECLILTRSLRFL